MANDVKVSGGINFAGLLAIVFIVLKLTKVINWSWWWGDCSNLDSRSDNAYDSYCLRFGVIL